MIVQLQGRQRKRRQESETYVSQTLTNCYPGSASQTPGIGFSRERRCQRGESWRETVKDEERGGKCPAITLINSCNWCIHTFLCFRISCPSGPNTVQLLYNLPPSSSGMDPGEQDVSLFRFFLQFTSIPEYPENALAPSWAGCTPPLAQSQLG